MSQELFINILREIILQKAIKISYPTSPEEGMDSFEIFSTWCQA